MNLKFDLEKSKGYKSNAQIARVLTENWVKNNSYCPNCGKNYLSEFDNNQPVADFYCNSCFEEFELKSKKGKKIGKKIVDGAYDSMIKRIKSKNRPNFFFLNYNNINWSVNNFLIIPNYYFLPEIIEKRKPLAPTARRAGWVGCNIELSKIPESGRIYLVKNSKIFPKEKVIDKWKSTDFLKHQKLETRGWTLDVLKCIENIESDSFKLNQVYSFEDELSAKHPDNKHIKDKIRQQLQILRDKEIIEFVSRGNYRKIIK